MIALSRRAVGGKRRSSSPKHSKGGGSSSLPPVNRSGNSKSNSDKRVYGKLPRDPYVVFNNDRLARARRRSACRPDIRPQSAEDQGKLTVVLDVDETLIHSRLPGTHAELRQDEDRKSDVSALDEFSFQLKDGSTVYVNKRPGLDDFLAHAGEMYELMAFTAGVEEYARPLLDWLDPDGTIFRYRLYRDSCLYMGGYYLKDLARLQRPMGRVILVDNNPVCFLPQLSNGVPISSFYDDPNDKALLVLTHFLTKLHDAEDVRPFLRSHFDLESLLADHRKKIVGV